MAELSILLLAGQRPDHVDPVAASANVAVKALVPILGKPMITYVVDALQAAYPDAQLLVSSQTPDLLKPDLSEKVVCLDGARTAPEAAIQALEEFGAPLLIATADAPLLTPEILAAFAKGRPESAGLSVALVKKEIVHGAYPDAKRTFIALGRDHVSGCNLFHVADPKAASVFRFWMSAERYRKQPIRLLRTVGLMPVFLKLTGQLTLERAFAWASRKFGIEIAPVVLPQPEACMDVDKPEDLELAQSILRARNG